MSARAFTARHWDAAERFADFFEPWFDADPALLAWLNRREGRQLTVNAKRPAWKRREVGDFRVHRKALIDAFELAPDAATVGDLPANVFINV